MTIPRRTVLVIEDEPALRNAMVRALGRLSSVEPVGVGTVRDALRSIGQNPPDLVISDLDLPDGSGIEVASELDRVALPVPILFVSGHLGRFRGRLPRRIGTDVFEKPLSLERLLSIVDDRLQADGEPPSAFGAADYVQLAGMGRRSVVISVRGRHTGRGEIVIRDGDVWSASDERGSGTAAFRRLAFLKDAVVTCRPMDAAHLGLARNVHGSCESVLLDAARMLDEEEASLDEEWDTQAVKRLTEPPPPPPMAAPTVTVTAAPSTSTTARFDELYEVGVDALLAKRFDDAFDAFERADAIAPGDARVHANLERLRKMGHGR